MRAGYLTLKNSDIVNKVFLLCINKEDISNHNNDIEIALNSIIDIGVYYEIYHNKKWINAFETIKNYINELR